MLIPLVEVALGIMRLSCERFFVLASVLLTHILFRNDLPPVAERVIRLNHRISIIFQWVCGSCMTCWGGQPFCVPDNHIDIGTYQSIGFRPIGRSQSWKCRADGTCIHVDRLGLIFCACRAHSGLCLCRRAPLPCLAMWEVSPQRGRPYSFVSSSSVDSKTFQSGPPSIVLSSTHNKSITGS